MKALRLLILAGCTFGFAGVASAGDDFYGYALAQRYPNVFKAYQAMLPKAYKKIAWLYKLDGTSDPVTSQTIGGDDYLSVWVCKPHDCGGNGVAILSTLDASRVVAEVQMDGVNGGNGQYFGNPSNDERAELDARFN